MTKNHSKKTSRRQFLAAASAISTKLSLSPGAFGSQTFPHSRENLTSISFNAHQGKGYCITKNNILKKAKQYSFTDRFIAFFQPYGADIISIQEAPDEGRIARIAAALKMNYVYFPGGGRGRYPGAILSKFRMVKVQNRPPVGKRYPRTLFRRHWGYAELETPFGPLQFFSIHLHPVNPDYRKREAKEVLQMLKVFQREKGSILLQGDFNHTPQDLLYLQWKKADLIDTFATKQENRNGYTMPVKHPRKRIDYIWASGSIARKVHSSKTLELRSQATIEGVVLSDHLPVFTSFQF